MRIIDPEQLERPCELYVYVLIELNKHLPHNISSALYIVSILCLIYIYTSKKAHSNYPSESGELSISNSLFSMQWSFSMLLASLYILIFIVWLLSIAYHVLHLVFGVCVCVCGPNAIKSSWNLCSLFICIVVIIISLEDYN